MSLNSLKLGLILVAAVGAAGIAPASADELAGQAGADGYRTAMRLGGSRSLYAPCRPSYNPNCVATRPAVKKMAASKQFQRDVSAVMDQAGLTKHTAQVLKILADADPAVLKEVEVPVGATIEWMGLWNKGKADIIRKLRWGGGKPARPFRAFAFSITDGPKTYNFLLPKPCANFALESITEAPPAECVAIEVQRDCERKTVSVRAVGGGISQNQIARVEVLRGGTKLGDLLPAQDFRYSGPLVAGRYTARAVDKFDREAPMCASRGEVVIEECPAPKPPPPPPPINCGVTATAVKGKGGYDVALDGSAATTGGSAVKSMTLEIVGPAGTVVPFEQQGKVQNSITLEPPFKANVFLRKPVNGTYTVRGKCEPVDPKVASANCEATFVIGQVAAAAAIPRWFADGAFGKQRRNYEMLPFAGAANTIEPGFCDPMIGVKFGPMIWLAEGKASFAPSAGVAFMFGDLGDFDFDPNEGNNVSFNLEAIVNYHFSPYGAYVGTGFGWWDVFDGDHNTGVWVVNFGVPVNDTNRLFVIGEGRVFFDSPDGVDNNYQLWGGLRYLFGAK